MNIHFVRFSPDQLADLLAGIAKERMRTAHDCPPSLIERNGGYDAWMEKALRRLDIELDWYKTELSKPPAQRLRETAQFWLDVTEQERSTDDDWAWRGEEALIGELRSMLDALDLDLTPPGANVQIAFGCLLHLNTVLPMLEYPIPDQLDVDEPLWADVFFPEYRPIAPPSW